MIALVPPATDRDRIADLERLQHQILDLEIAHGDALTRALPHLAEAREWARQLSVARAALDTLLDRVTTEATRG